MHLYNSSQNEREGLEGFFQRLSGQSAQSEWSILSEKEVVRDLFIAKLRFKDFQRELCIRRDYSLEETLKSALFQEKGSVTASALQKQMDQTAHATIPFQAKTP